MVSENVHTHGENLAKNFHSIQVSILSHKTSLEKDEWRLSHVGPGSTIQLEWYQASCSQASWKMASSILFALMSLLSNWTLICGCLLSCGQSNMDGRGLSLWYRRTTSHTPNPADLPLPNKVGLYLSDLWMFICSLCQDSCASFLSKLACTQKLASYKVALPITVTLSAAKVSFASKTT